MSCQTSGTCYAAYPFKDSYAYPSIDLREVNRKLKVKNITNALPSWAYAMTTTAEFSVIRTQYAQRLHNSNWILEPEEALSLSERQIADSASDNTGETSLRRWSYLQQNNISMATDSDYDNNQAGPIKNAS